jgi:hypothetical protein
LAFALIERDGRTLLISWISCIAIMISFGIGLWFLGLGFMHWVFGLFS